MQFLVCVLVDLDGLKRPHCSVSLISSRLTSFFAAGRHDTASTLKSIDLTRDGVDNPIRTSV
jgi:hypothetical protein